jgi:hypothetical protein
VDGCHGDINSSVRVQLGRVVQCYAFTTSLGVPPLKVSPLTACMPQSARVEGDACTWHRDMHCGLQDAVSVPLAARTSKTCAIDQPQHAGFLRRRSQ